jgi:CHAT domain-containing protein
MERFYDNYWKKGQGALEALREAQLWPLQDGATRRDVLVATGAEATKAGRTPPLYWAAFVLSSDWR